MFCGCGRKKKKKGEKQTDYYRKASPPSTGGSSNGRNGRETTAPMTPPPKHKDEDTTTTRDIHIVVGRGVGGSHLSQSTDSLYDDANIPFADDQPVDSDTTTQGKSLDSGLETQAASTSQVVSPSPTYYTVSTNPAIAWVSFLDRCFSRLPCLLHTHSHRQTIGVGLLVMSLPPLVSVKFRGAINIAPIEL